MTENKDIAIAEEMPVNDLAPPLRAVKLTVF